MTLPNIIEAKRITLYALQKPSFDMSEKLFHEINSSRERLKEWLPWVDTIQCAEDEYSRYLVELCQTRWNAGIGFAYAIFLRNAVQILGCIEIFNISWNDKSGEIGYWLSNTAEGYGYMTEAVNALDATAFSAELESVVIKTDKKNLRSCHVAERCGYVLEEIIHNDTWDKFHQCFRDTAIWRKYSPTRRNSLHSLLAP